MRCEGKCFEKGECKGEATEVILVGYNLVNYGAFTFCEAAIERSRKEGYTITPKEEFEDIEYEDEPV